ncbi:hypothetical protein ABT154_19150 [Streptomyces sp. NPDC001728]|uniref:hypothetical protein n=1 Tax=Streptomyces sp. NPDC001728 TaxID=3154396 RepID=UPI003328F927
MSPLTRRLRELTYRGAVRTYGFDRANVYRFTDQAYVHRIERGAPRFLGDFVRATKDDTAARKARTAAEGR